MKISVMDGSGRVRHETVSADKMPYLLNEHGENVIAVVPTQMQRSYDDSSVLDVTEYHVAYLIPTVPNVVLPDG